MIFNLPKYKYICDLGKNIYFPSDEKFRILPKLHIGVGHIKFKHAEIVKKDY